MSRREEIAQRVEAATPGPWRDQSEHMTVYQDFVTLDYFLRCATQSQVLADAALIAHAPEDLRWLLDENARLRDVLQQISDAAADGSMLADIAAVARARSVLGETET